MDPVTHDNWKPENIPVPDAIVQAVKDVPFPNPIKSDGGTTSYYQLPDSATELNDLIEFKGMSFALGNIFKACYRLGEKDGADPLYDIRKMKYFAERLEKFFLKYGRLP